jgi:alkyl hydroperoxide reductase subunit AhpF
LYTKPQLENAMKDNFNTITGFDGSTIKLHSRVEMHPGTDFWMRGARFGSVVALNGTTEKVRVKLDRIRSTILVDGTAVRSIDEPTLEVAHQTKVRYCSHCGGDGFENAEGGPCRACCPDERRKWLLDQGRRA